MKIGLRTHLKTILILTLLSVTGYHGFAQSITGRWKTVDDVTGKERSIVDIYQKGEAYYGKIIKIFPQPGEPSDPICVACTDERKDQKVIGMEIITDLKYDPKDNEYIDGEILDPENGNIYDVKLWVDDKGKLKVRGYLYFFHRTQTWLPVDS